ncbi:MAG: phosphoglycerate dehydrogenase [Microthrixaceae bacterium]
MARILVTEKIADPGLDRLRQAGHEVDIRLGLTPEELVATMPGAAALIVRSSTQVTDEVLAAGSDLVMVGRAGIGLDNVDVSAATDRGVMVVNAPQSNTLSAAEHTMAMLLAMARNIPQAHQALREGRWERSKWNGVELAEKTLGVIGLGRIGTLVAQRAMAFGMKLAAYDPFVSAERARQLNVELLGLEDLLARSDFLTLHLAKTPETVGLLDAKALASARPGVRIVNVARGGIIVEEDLAEAVRSGHVAGAALDVFAAEPTTESPLFELDNVIVTPHLGASTTEAQDKAGNVISDMVLLALAGDFVPFAVNVEAAEVPQTVRPFLGLADDLGRIFAGLVGANTQALEIELCGQIAEHDTRLLALSAQKGFFGAITDQPVSYVNAPQIAEQQGIEVRAVTCPESVDYLSRITVSGGGHSVSGALVGLSHLPKVVGVDGHAVDISVAPYMLVIHNQDVPGRIGFVGGVLGDAGVNIEDMNVGKNPSGEGSLMVVTTTEATPHDVVERLRTGDGIESVRSVG